MAQHLLQDAAVLVVVELVDRIDAAEQRHPLEAAVGGDDLGTEPLLRLEISAQAADDDLPISTSI
jgi:hypothetical protein